MTNEERIAKAEREANREPLFQLHDPQERLTRAEFFMELMNGWERSLTLATKTRNWYAAGLLKSALEALKTSYSARELVNLDFYEQELAEQQETTE